MREFKQSESYIVQMKLVSLMLKMHIQVANLHRKIQEEIQRVSFKGKRLENKDKDLMMTCIMGSLDEVLTKDQEDEFEQSLIQEEVQCQLQGRSQKDQEQSEQQLLNNLSFVENLIFQANQGSLPQSQKSFMSLNHVSFEHERRVQVTDMLMQFVHRNYKYSVELKPKTNILNYFECVQGRLYQQVKRPV